MTDVFGLSPAAKRNLPKAEAKRRAAEARDAIQRLNAAEWVRESNPPEIDRANWVEVLTHIVLMEVSEDSPGWRWLFTQRCMEQVNRDDPTCSRARANATCQLLCLHSTAKDAFDAGERAAAEVCAVLRADPGAGAFWDLLDAKLRV